MIFYCCDKISDKRNLWNYLFRPKLKAYCGREGMVGYQCEVAGYIVLTAEKLRKMNARCLHVFSILFSPRLQPLKP